MIVLVPDHCLSDSLCLFIYTRAERQWLKHFSNHEKMFETMVVRANSVDHRVRTEGIIGISFRFFDMKICCVFSLGAHFSILFPCGVEVDYGALIIAFPSNYD